MNEYIFPFLVLILHYRIVGINLISSQFNEIQRSQFYKDRHHYYSYFMRTLRVEKGLAVSPNLLIWERLET